MTSMLRRMVCGMLLCAVVLSCGVGAQRADTALQQSSEDAVRCLAGGSLDGLSMLALCLFEEKPAALGYFQIQSLVESEDLSPDDCAKTILNVTAAGYDAGNVYGKDLPALLVHSGDDRSQSAAVLSRMVLALCCRSLSLPEDALFSAESLRGELLALQNQDGGFPLYAGYQSDAETTAWAMFALMTDPQAPAQPLDGAAAFLAKTYAQSEEGAFAQDTYCKPFYLALAACTLFCERYGGESGLPGAQALLSLQNPDGGFPAAEGLGSDEEATAYALLALYSLREGKSPFDLEAFPHTQPLREVESLSPVLTAVLYLLLSIVLLYAVLLVLCRLRRKRRERAASHF